VKAITETFFAADRETWRAWLAAHHAERSEIWLVFLKKHVGEPCVTLDEAVEDALCFGWIDGLLRRIDERSHALRFSPRKLTSQWSPSNKQRVERLVAEGRMTPAGLAAYRRSRGTRRRQPEAGRRAGAIRMTFARLGVGRGRDLTGRRDFASFRAAA
jgi:uncharacterized protein YdeI (YjbR/CyaY-like superfamily)